ncbi:MAG: hypothetical protein IJ710_09630 [Prevotella sp.]|nr:hypothetical protein [Prevotella sp.]
MNRILFIDYKLEEGHVNFNRIHINALKDDGYAVSIVLHRDIADQLPFNESEYALILPRLFNKRPGHPILNRIIFILTLLYIKLHIHFQEYEAVIVSSCEEISLGLMPLCRNMYIICHGNANTLGNRVKRFFMNRLARHNYFLTLNEYMAAPLRQAGYPSTYVISHGCLPTPGTLHNVPPVVDLSPYALTLFHPSSKTDPAFLNEILADPGFISFIEQQNILIIMRSAAPKGVPASSHIVFIPYYLSNQQYQSLLSQVDIVLIAYPADFKYQVSGISYECITYGKRLLAYQKPALSYCKDFYNYDPLFAHKEQLCERLTYLMHHAEAKCIVTPQDLHPDYTAVFSKTQKK